MVHSELRIRIQESHFLEASLKNDLVKYYDQLNNVQISCLMTYFENEKKYLIEFLQTLKKRKSIDFCTIKTQIHIFMRDKIHSKEYLERQEEKQEGEFLLNTLE